MKWNCPSMHPLPNTVMRCLSCVHWKSQFGVVVLFHKEIPIYTQLLYCPLYIQVLAFFIHGFLLECVKTKNDFPLSNFYGCQGSLWSINHSIYVLMWFWPLKISELIKKLSDDVHNVLNYYNNLSSFTFLFKADIWHQVSNSCANVVFTLLPGVAGVTGAIVYIQQRV